MSALTENYGLATGVVTDDLIQPEHQNRVAETLDRALGSFLKKLMAAGAYQGWLITLSGTVSAGEGLVSGCWCSTTAEQAIEGLTPGAVNYVFAGTVEDSAPAGAVRFSAGLTSTKPPGSLLLGQVELDGAGEVTAVDNAITGVDRDCRKLQVGFEEGAGTVTDLDAGAEEEVTIQHSRRFVVPGSVEVSCANGDFSWTALEACRPDEFRILVRNDGATQQDFDYDWVRYGIVE